jgi:hypothetical protein
MQFFYKYTSQGSGASYRKLYQAIVSAFQYEGNTSTLIYT